MFKKKKVIIIVLATAAAIVGITAGAVFAQEEDEEVPQSEARQEAMLERVCEIYEANTGVAIDEQELQDAFAEARGEMAAEAMNNRLAAMVENGIITQEEADQYREWHESRPDISPPGFRHLSPGGPGGFGMGGFGMSGFGPNCGRLCPKLESFDTN